MLPSKSKRVVWSHENVELKAPCWKPVGPKASDGASSWVPPKRTKITGGKPHPQPTSVDADRGGGTRSTQRVPRTVHEAVHPTALPGLTQAPVCHEPSNHWSATQLTESLVRPNGLEVSSSGKSPPRPQHARTAATPPWG